MGCNLKKKTVLEPRDLKAQQTSCQSSLPRKRQRKRTCCCPALLRTACTSGHRSTQARIIALCTPKPRTTLSTRAVVCTTVLGTHATMTGMFSGRAWCSLSAGRVSRKSPSLQLRSIWMREGSSSSMVSATAPRRRRCGGSWKGLFGRLCGGKMQNGWQGKFLDRIRANY